MTRDQAGAEHLDRGRDETGGSGATAAGSTEGSPQVFAAPRYDVLSSPKPDSPYQDQHSLARGHYVGWTKAAAEHQRIWTDWLAASGFGIDYVSTIAPPCTIEDLAAAYHRATGEEDIETWVATIEAETDPFGVHRVDGSHGHGTPTISDPAISDPAATFVDLSVFIGLLLPALAAEHRLNEVTEEVGTRIYASGSRTRAKCDGEDCGFYASAERRDDVLALHRDHVVGQLTEALLGAAGAAAYRASARAAEEAAEGVQRPVIVGRRPDSDSDIDLVGFLDRLPGIIERHQMNAACELDSSTWTRDLDVRATCASGECDFRAQGKRYWDVVGAHDQHLVEVLIAELR